MMRAAVADRFGDGMKATLGLAGATTGSARNMRRPRKRGVPAWLGAVLLASVALPAAAQTAAPSAGRVRDPADERKYETRLEAYGPAAVAAWRRATIALDAGRRTSSRRTTRGRTTGARGETRS